MRTQRRLPGFSFEAQSPQLNEALPRMDVAVFVGFAARGPLHLPVAVEDAAQFAEIFGADAPLAWDTTRGEQVFAYLAPAVRSFFRQGGRRCWVVRVAGEEARANYFPVPCLAAAEFDEQGRVSRVTPAFAQARSEGSWSDALRVSAALQARPVEVVWVGDEGQVAQAAVSSFREVAEGDLLRVSFEGGYVLMLAATAVEPAAELSPPGRKALRVTGRAVWLRKRLLHSPPAGFTGAKARFFTRVGDVVEGAPPDFESAPATAVARWPADEDQPLELDLTLPIAAASALGSLIRVQVGDEEFWLAVRDVVSGEGIDLPPGEVVRVRGEELWLLKDAPPLPAVITAAEILTFELQIRQGNEATMRLSELGLAAGHARFWGDLPPDGTFYRDAGKAFEAGRAELAFEKEQVELGRSKPVQRFALAGGGQREAVFFPVGMPFTHELYLGPVEAPGTPLERDGLAEFDARLFLDPDLIETGVSTFMDRADFLRYLSRAPRPLRGIHAALGFGESAIIDEATIVAVPDAAHRGWSRTGSQPAPAAELSSPPARPEWWRFLDCDPPPEIPRVRTPQWGNFLTCDLRVLDTPTLWADEPDPSGTFALYWTTPAPDASYVLEEAAQPDFSGAAVIAAGRQARAVVYGRSQGEYYYRVRAERGREVSDWSNGIGVRVAAGLGWRMKSEEEYSAETLLAVQRALLRMCAARGDLCAALALPEHYREEDAVAHVEALRSGAESSRGAAAARPIEIGRALQLPLSRGEGAALSYAALYHPWLVGREEERPEMFRRTPPDGAACGLWAARTLARGAWVAPANEGLRGVVALTPSIAAGQRQRLQETQINLVRQEPRGFLALSADTLSLDEDLRPINVRRLLILLRRLALRRGALYVFEPNNDAFRRAVQRGFEALLDEMFLRGAFAGATAAAAYRVVTDASVNTPQSLDQGRFVVELKVAPALPMTFLPIRVVQRGDRTLLP